MLSRSPRYNNNKTKKKSDYCDIQNKLPRVPRILLHAWILHLNQRRLLFSYLCLQLMLNETTYEEPEEVYIILWRS